jgi:uncharacterized protein (UPF0332 family)
MTPESQALLAAANAKLKAAELLLKEGLAGDAASRAYYAVFHAISAVHLANGNTFSSHAQLIGRFNKDFVRTGLFAPEFTRIVTRLFQDRQLGDYDATTAIPDTQARQDIDDAHRLIDAIRVYLTTAATR